MKKLQTMKRILIALLTVSMLLSCTVLAAGTPTAQSGGKTPTLLLSLDQTTSYEVSFTLSDADAALAGAKGAEVIWTLHRQGSYANPGKDDAFYPILNETRDGMYPNEMQEIVLNDLVWDVSDYSDWCATDPFTVDHLKTSVKGNTLTLKFDTTAMTSDGNPGVPHVTGGPYIDLCGSFELVATVGGKQVDLGTRATVTIKPYASFHTMWEVYDEIDAIAKLGDNNASTSRPYVAKYSMGTSALGYDMPYLIIAKDSKAVSNWLKLCQRAETEPDQVLAELKSGKLSDYQVPVMFSNIHSNEVAAVDAVLAFARMLMEDETIEYNKLTGFTAAGKKELQRQRDLMGLHTPELIEPLTTYLGSIVPEDNDFASPWEDKQYSGKVAGFDEYYTQEDVKLDVDEMLDSVFFILVPEENVEGRIYLSRTSSGGYDLNRDNSFQSQAETVNMQHLIATFNPVTLTEFHGQVNGYQFEPCSPPHEPNVEYDLLSRHLMPGGEAMGAAAVANNDAYQSYVIPMRDYLVSDENGDPFWQMPWDDMSTSYTPQFAMMQGCVAYTVEMPAYSEDGCTADTYAMVGLGDYVAEQRDSYFEAQLEIYSRGVANANSDKEVAPWFADCHDVEGAEADLFRPANKGNGQFFPECYIIPLDGEHQTNLQAAYDMIVWLTRNDVKVGITDKEITFAGETYPAGTMIVSMYQAKRSVANGVLYDGTLIRDWTDLYSEGITAFCYTRGFDQVVCTDPTAYQTIAAAVGKTLDAESGAAFAASNAKSYFTGEKDADVVISNASEDAVAAVNALLKAGKKVAMITDGKYKGDFICSYADWLTVSGEYVLSGTGMKSPNFTAFFIKKAPTVYISGTARALEKSDRGYVYGNRISDSAYNYDRVAMELMNFNTTTDASKADAVIGASALDEGAMAAVKKGVPYVGYTYRAVSSAEELLSFTTDNTDGMDCLSTVVYPNETMVNASYIADGDNVFYGYGLNYFTSIPDGAKALVKRDGKTPMEGFMNGDDVSYEAFVNGIMGFEYEGKDKSGNHVSMVLFANSLTQKAHQRDEYAFISNAIFSNLLSDETYVEGWFADVPSDAYYADAVKWAVDAGITRGTGKAAFSPNAACTRAQTVTFLWRAAGKPAPTSKNNPFTDVSADDYFYEAVLWAVEQGITKGTSATTFSPNAAVTRAQAVTFLWRAAGSAAADGENPFTDVPAGAFYAKATVWAVSAGVSKGTSKTTFSGNQDCTRAQIAAMLYRAN